MPDFDQARSALNASRKALEHERTALAAARQRVARLSAEHGAALRGNDREQLQKLGAALKRAQGEAAQLRDRLDTIGKDVASRADIYAALADPRRTIGQWHDETPILLLPVRLETRFKRIEEAAGVRDELWVRVYPDQCAVDTFEATLSENEAASGRRYWIETWAAGGVDAQRRAAWRNLVASHGVGRATWIVRELAPAPGAVAPDKAHPTDIVLVIPTDALPPQAQQDALAAYWKSAWLAEGDKAKIDAATAALRAATGLADVAPLVARFEPANLAATPPAPMKRGDVAISVTWLPLPAMAEVKARSWTAPPRVSVLPDRFVIVGYQGGKVAFEALGGLIPSPLVAGPDPSAPADEQLKHDAHGDLIVPDDMRWMVDFEAAVANGMGLRIPLDPQRVDLYAPIDRVIALGVRMTDDADAGRARLEALLTHHRYGRAGFAFAPQGTPTNNTEAEGAGYSRDEDADAAYEALHGSADRVSPTDDWRRRCDGQWLADALGVDPAVFDRVPHAGRADFVEARAMNRALWPATFGYAMETMLHPVFDPAHVEATRWFFTHFVTGRGFLPSVRIGDQPYGVLPISALAQATWLADDRVAHVGGLDLPANFLPYRQGLARVLAAMRADWATLANGVSFVGKSGDAHQLLLDVLGLHPASVEFHQRYAESLEHIFNRAKLQGLAAQIVEHIRVRGLQAQAMALLAKLGYTGKIEPDALSKFFFTGSHRLNGPLVDDRPLSETEPIRAYAADGARNYIEWLIDAAHGAFEDLRLERGFKDDRAPDALLYMMLRHALLLGYLDASLHLHVDAKVLDEDAAKRARREPAFVHVAEDVVTTGGESESRYKYLYSTDARITQQADRTVARRITDLLGESAATRALAEQLAALERLKRLPTARLERCFAEHIDLASHRLDAWLLGLVNYQLAALRYRPRGRGREIDTRRGIYLGAYGWLENLQRKPVALRSMELDEALQSVFGGKDAAPLQRDPLNGGYIFAPSLNQATTAAILRAGYLANASPQTPGALAVNLTSARVRVALGLIEGIRNGQPLGALLGYRLQRGLHEHHGALELDRFIYPLRKQFPLVANQLASTQDAAAAIETIEANNVADGLKLVEHIRKTGNRAYPFGLALPQANAAEAAAINAEIEALLDAHDALADLALAEGVHQAVLGNYDRVAATMDAYAKGTFPPEPEVVRTPRSGLALTHRVALHFEGGVDPGVSPIAGIAMTPRARAQAMVNKWLAGVLPHPTDVAVAVQWLDPISGTMQEQIVTQQALQLQPIDLLYLGVLDGAAGMSELDDRILRQVAAARSPRADATLTIRHTERLAAPLMTFFEVAPLVRHLRALLLGSRPLAASDVALPGEAQRAYDATQTISRARVEKVWNDLDALRQNLVAAAIAPPVDAAIDTVIALFADAARFGIQQVGWGFIFEWRRAAFAKLAARLREVLVRWTERLARFDAGLIDYGNLPATATDDERFAALATLELLVAASNVSPRPATPAAYLAALPARRAAFAIKRDTLQALLDTTTPGLAPFLAAIQAELPFGAFDNTPFAVDDVAREIDVFVADLKARVGALKREVERRLQAATGQMQKHDAAADPAARVAALQNAGSALLGEDMHLLPEFTFDAQQAAELANSYAESASGALTSYLRTQKNVALPVDDWFAGLARVRPKLYALEQAGLYSATLGRSELALTPIQLPYRPGEGWLALELDPATVVDGERLLYTAHYASAPNPGAPACGLLVDEWTEVIPARDETAGLAFQYDRPGSEPPQTWLLVTPARMDGRWQWSDLVGALHETLDLARLRAVEPAQVDTQAYARFLPATTSAVTLYGISIAANFSRVNKVLAHLPGGADD